MNRKIILTLIIVTLIGVLLAESLEENLQKFAGNNAQGYLKPLVNTLGTGLNSGFYNTAKVLSPIMPNVKVGFVYISLPKSDKTFMAKGVPVLDANGIPEFIVPNDPTSGIKTVDVKTATIFGDEGAPIGDYATLPDGADLPFVPFANASASIGLPFGNEVMVRYIPSVNLGKAVGEFNYWGVGVKHSIDQHLPLGFLPLSISAQYVYQSMTLGDIVDIKTHAGNVQGSIDILMFSIYGGLGVESASLNVKYDYKYKDPLDNNAEKSIPVKLDLESDNSVKMTIGAGISPFPLVNVYADYNIAKYPSVNVGLRVGM